LHAIGDYSRPKVRLPGGAGSAMLYYMVKKVILFKTDHTVKSFVETTDFITSAASSPPTHYRPGGLHLVITPLAVLVKNSDNGLLELLSFNPGTSAEEVRANTGFNLPDFSGGVTKTIPPGPEELTLLRGPVRESIAKIYPRFAGQAFKS
jgi:glutaconate CoA-transferase subunit B